jgi:hypothetical protein
MCDKGRRSIELKEIPRRRGESLKRKRKEENTVQQYSEREKRRIAVETIRMDK